MCAWWAVAGKRMEGCDTHSTICGMAAVAAAVVTTGGDACVCVSLDLEVQTAAVRQGRVGQGVQREC